jgi:hypothetical protein
MTTDLTIVNEIRRQIYAGGMEKVWSWGAHAWGVVDKHTLRFRVTGRIFRGVVTVCLTPMDVYRVELLKLDGTVVKTFDMVYCDQLTDVIDTAVERVSEYKR